MKNPQKRPAFSPEAKHKIFITALAFCLLLSGCNTVNTDQSPTNSPLEEPYAYFDQLSADEFKLEELEHDYLKAKGKNDKDGENAILKKIEESHAACIQKLEEKFPSGSVKIPFEQTGSKDSISITSVYVSGFTFPWNTARNISYYFTVEYTIHNKEAWNVPITLKYIDKEDDVIYINGFPANSSGKTRFVVRTQPSFRSLTKIIVNP